MKKIINYEKDILFKTNIGEITSISLEHDFTLEEGILKGDFLISGEYKPNEISVNKEKFDYRLPLEYELDPTVDMETLSYDIDDFEYTVKDDCLTVYIDFGVRYEEKSLEPIIPNIGEEELNAEYAQDSELESSETETRNLDLETIVAESKTVEPSDSTEGNITDPIVEVDELADRLDDEDKDAIVESFIEEDEYITYHVHIVREGDTLESIAEKYNCSIELIKEYNSFETLEEKLKLLIPEVQDE